jgi:preprotein translocase subunit SecA
MFWMTHLEDMESLRDSVRLRAYGQRDPLIEYRREAHIFYKQMLARFDEWMEENKEKLAEEAERARTQGTANVPPAIAANAPSAPTPDVGRNDPCPCGAKHDDGRPMKYKHCHGK